MKKFNFLAASSVVMLSWSLITAQDLSSGLVAFYQFNKNANDSTALGNNGIIQSGSLIGARFVTDRFGFDSSALSLNNSYVQVPDANCFDFTNQFSISVWVHSTTGGTFVSKPRAVGGTGIRFAGGATGISIGLNNGGQNYLLSAPLGLASTNWHNYVVTYNGDSVKLYADSILINAAQYQITFLNSTQPLFIGYESPDLGGYFEGDIDDIKIYNRALTSTEVKQLYSLSSTKLSYGVNLKARCGINTSRIKSIYYRNSQIIYANSIGTNQAVNLAGRKIQTNPEIIKAKRQISH